MEKYKHTTYTSISVIVSKQFPRVESSAHHCQCQRVEMIKKHLAVFKVPLELFIFI
jgi:hypothetical protein